MFLSNRHAGLLALFLIITFGAGCSYFQSTDAPPEPGVITPPVSSIPFETREPDIYQADFVTIAGGSETHSHFARKAGNWRFDSFAAGRPERSIIQTDRQVYIDHPSKTYSESPAGSGTQQPQFLADMTASLLAKKPPAKFEKTGTEGKIEKYRVTPDDSSPSIVSYDTEIKMVVRQEIGDGFAFEMRNFTLEVDDALFRVPLGYRKIAWAEFLKR